MQESFRAPGKSFIDRHREVLTRLRFKPTGTREGSAHHRVMRPQGLCLPIISMAVRLQLDENNTITKARISMGPVGPVPFLAESAMEVLVGGVASAEQFDKTADATHWPASHCARASIAQARNIARANGAYLTCPSFWLAPSSERTGSGIMSRLQMTVNGKPVDLDVPESRYLSEVLRKDLQLTGTKIGCNEAECGICYRAG